MQMFLRKLAFVSLAIFAALFCDVVRADETPMMKAVVAHQYGAPEVLKFEDVPRPEPKRK